MFKSKIRFFTFILCTLPITVLADAPVATTAGGNLTSFNGSMGAINNNEWNQVINPGTRIPAADFGNCNAVIMRCAQPKCANAGCVDINVAYPIASGCVMATPNCKSHGEALIQSIAAQLVASSTAKSNASANAAQMAASAQSSEQVQQIQSQMQQMQEQMMQQNAQSAAALQNALEEQKQLAAAQAEQARQAATEVDAAAQPAAAIASAVAGGVSADVLAREQASGQIMTKVENADVSMKALKKTMQNTFDYAGCDASGNNCKGPRRVAVFKQKANEFFDPYENVLDEIYDGLIMAQSLGVDITDIYMMLNGSCNVWGKYFCAPDQELRYSSKDTEESKRGKIKPLSDGGCQLIQMLNNNEEVQQNWLYPEDGTSGGGGRVMVGCASEALDNSLLFRGRKKQASIDIETLQRIINQDAPSIMPSGKTATDLIEYCKVSNTEQLQTAVGLKKLSITPICTKTLGGSEKIDCGSETANYVNPALALCSAHVYNIGGTENPKDPAELQRMNDVVALKSTVITQQMKKQYDYLDATIKRFRIQLEKAILVSKLEAAGADSSINSPDKGGSKSNDRNIILSGTENCNNKRTTADVYSCLYNNYNLIYNMSNNGQTLSTDIRKQLASDYKIMQNNSIVDTYKVSNKDGKNIYNDCTDAQKISNRDKLQSCLADLNSGIRQNSEKIERDNRTPQRNNY